MIDAKILDRIRRLLVFAQDTASPHEAAIAAVRAEALMRKHNIEATDAILDDLKSNDSIIRMTSDPAYAATGKLHPGQKLKRLPNWATTLAFSVAKLFDCEAREGTNSNYGACVNFLGYKTDVEVAVWTFNYLIQVIKRFSRQYADDNPNPNRGDANAYRAGVVYALDRSLDRSLEKARLAKEARNKNNSSSTALVVAKKDAIKEKFGETTYKKTKGPKGDYAAYLRGIADGRKVNVNPNVVTEESNVRVHRIR